MVPGRMHSVLIVEDERIVALDLQETLVEMGYDAFAIASSADEALRCASERCPDLVLMDIRIEGERDGIETATLLRERFGVPVVYLTAHADEATIERANRTQPYGYLVKPVRSAELRSAIEVAIYRHEMEQRLRTRERWFSTTLRSIGDAVVAVDLAGNVSYMNPAAETLTGVTAAHAIGRPVRDVVRTGDPAPASTARIISDHASPVVDDGEVLGTVMVFRDITEQKLLQKQLELSDRLASLGTMAAGIAHEVNTPLAIVVANASYVLEELRHQQGDAASDVRGLSEAIQAQSEIEAAARQIARIIEDLETFARPVQEVGAGDVGAAVAWAVRSTVAELRSRARVVTNVPAALRVRLDETRLGQVVVNLLLNAAQAIIPGRVDVNTVEISASQDGDQVVIDVRDTGGGMPPEIVAHVFEPFYTTKPAGAGTGLGLSVCHGIVTSVGGHLDVKSQIGEGSTFRITLPAATRGVATGPTARAPLIEHRHGRILVIDDDPMVLRTIKRMLSAHEVVCVQDPREVVPLLARSPQFDIIFSDVVMPYLTGVELYERLLEESPEIARRMVFLTGGALDQRTADFLDVVRNVCMKKPFSVDDLRAFVQETLASQ